MTLDVTGQARTIFIDQLRGGRSHSSSEVRSTVTAQMANARAISPHAKASIDIATAGTPQESSTVELPLTYRGELAGTLVVGLRRGERDLHDADRRTLTSSPHRSP